MSKTGVSFGKNIVGRVEGSKLFLEVDLSKRIGPSKSGRTTIVASTGPSVEVAPGIRLGLNCYTK